MTPKTAETMALELQQASCSAKRYWTHLSLILTPKTEKRCRSGIELQYRTVSASMNAVGPCEAWSAPAPDPVPTLVVRDDTAEVLSTLLDTRMSRKNVAKWFDPHASSQTLSRWRRMPPTTSSPTEPNPMPKAPLGAGRSSMKLTPITANDPITLITRMVLLTWPCTDSSAIFCSVPPPWAASSITGLLFQHSSKLWAMLEGAFTQLIAVQETRQEARQEARQKPSTETKHRK